MSEVMVIGIDLAKRIFHLHGAGHDGSVVFRKRLSRGQLLAFMSQVPQGVVAMEACSTAHGRDRTFEKFVHEALLIPLVYVKPFVKRQKNDCADIEAIVEAALRPTMRESGGEKVDHGSGGMSLLREAQKSSTFGLPYSTEGGWEDLHRRSVSQSSPSLCRGHEPA